MIEAEYPGVHAFLEAVLAPGVKLAGRFAMLWKIALVCVVLLVPSVVLGVGYWSGMTAQTSFAASEGTGVVYATPLMKLMASTVELRSANVRLALGDRSQARAAASARAGIAAQLRALDSVVAHDSGGFGLAPEWRSARAAVSAFAARPGGSDATAEVSAADTALTQLNAMLTEMLNDSKLILDPDLDSYAAMDAWLLRAPVILDVATRASSEIAAGLPHGGRADLTWRSGSLPHALTSRIHWWRSRATSPSCGARPTTPTPHTSWGLRLPGSRDRSKCSTAP